MDCEECGNKINNVNVTSLVANGLHCFCSEDCRKEYLKRELEYRRMDMVE